MSVVMMQICSGISDTDVCIGRATIPWVENDGAMASGQPCKRRPQELSLEFKFRALAVQARESLTGA
jgi:hypothetical protein